MSEKIDVKGLKPCPFCGGPGMVYKILDHKRYVYKVMCGARVNCCGLYNSWLTPEAARDGWNKRNGKT